MLVEYYHGHDLVLSISLLRRYSGYFVCLLRRIFKNLLSSPSVDRLSNAEKRWRAEQPVRRYRNIVFRIRNQAKISILPLSNAHLKRNRRARTFTTVTRNNGLAVQICLSYNSCGFCLTDISLVYIRFS